MSLDLRRREECEELVEERSPFVEQLPAAHCGGRDALGACGSPAVAFLLEAVAFLLEAVAFPPGGAGVARLAGSGRLP